MKLAFIGVGKLGGVLAERFRQHGHEIVVAYDNVDSHGLPETMYRQGGYSCFPVQKAVDLADMVFFVVPFAEVEKALRNIYFDGKVLVDCTNPIDINYKHSLDSVAGGSEYVQLIAKDAKVVKAFSINSPNDYSPLLEQAQSHPLMMLAGNCEEAKKKVILLAEEIGFEAFDVGGLEQSLHLEHFAILYEKTMQGENASRLTIALYHCGN